MTDAEITAAIEVLRSGQLSRGVKQVEFEHLFAAYVGTSHAIAVSSGTAALHLSLIAAGVTDGDLVVTSPFSFIASANCILYERAVPVFADVDPATGNLEASIVAETLERQPPGRVKAVLPVHVFGRPVDMTSLMNLASARHIAVVEDACEALGAEWDGRRVGTFGDAGCFAFYPNKQMTTGEGGMIVTSDDRTAALCRSLRNQGRDEDDSSVSRRLGYNYRLSELACAIGLVQLSRIDELQARRVRVARWYDARLAGRDDLFCPAPAVSGSRLSWFAYVVRFRDAREQRSARERLAKAGIPSRTYFHVIPLQPFYAERFGYRRGDFPHAEHLSDTCLALPFSGLMTEADVEQVAVALGCA